MRLIYDGGEFVSAYIMQKTEGEGHRWTPWEFGKNIRRPDVTTVCKSFHLSNENYNAYMQSK